MDCIVLDSKPDNQYGDSPEEYRFPARYLSLFAPLGRGLPIFALIYEPQGGDRHLRGRMAYVGWALLKTSPEETERVNGQRRWRVSYAEPYRQFPSPVPRSLGGITLESALRAGSHSQVGNAVRAIPQREAQIVLELAYGGQYWPEIPYDSVDVTAPEPEVVARERVDRLVTAIQRDARFADDVVSAYDGACAISGFSTGSTVPRRTFGLIDAAHIRPVKDSGPDVPSNGLALTPTLHRLFDARLFSLEGPADRLVVVRSRHLDERMICSPDGRFVFSLENGTPIRAPMLPGARPNGDMVSWHRSRLLE